jgi:alkaline phosphatase D
MADNPATPNGTSWTNAFLDAVPEKRKVAETLREFHRNHLYNRYDANVQRFSAEVPQIWQWDDHEVVNNWSDSKDLSADTRYTEKRVQTLTARAGKAFLDYAPLRWHSQEESERVYRKIAYGRDLDVFVLDMRSYRGPNTANLQTEPGPETQFLGHPCAVTSPPATTNATKSSISFGWNSRGSAAQTFATGAPMPSKSRYLQGVGKSTLEVYK